ncbi:hypothetical protein AB0K51_12405 [Kitasatospora sp. NPDC049285]|uniref:hypothetical protein n=1 Tax=Kitasatospora sp. NPDC049285 TaxID=3157096 RepID=UPI003415EB97
MNWRALFTGMLGLALLEAAVSSNAAAERAGGLLTSLAAVINHVLDPTVPAIPDLRKHGGAAPPASAPAPSTGGTLLPAEWTTSATALYT